MKKNLLLFALAFLVVCLASCGDDEGPDVIGPEEVTDADVESIQEIEQVQGLFLALDDVANTAIDADNGGRTKSCGEVTTNIGAGSISYVIDFGTGCTDEFGNEYSGRMLYEVTLEGESGVSTFVMTFDNFTSNGSSVSGTITTSNVVTSEDGSFSYDYTISNGVFTEASGSTVTLNQTSTFMFDFGSEGLFDIDFSYSGSSNGSVDGTAFSSQITTPILIKFACAEQEVVVPVSGVQELTINNRPTMTIDYGDGTCDNIAVVSIGNSSRSVDLTL